MSLIVDTLTYGTGSHTTSSETANALATDLVNDGVVGALTNTAGVAPATGGFSVNAQGTPDATVAVGAGVAYVTGTPTSQGSQRLRVKLTAGANVTISANATGGTRYDWIYIKLDPTNMANPNTAADNVATLTSSRSTSASTDNGTGVTYGYCIAVVTVANGFTTITNGNIIDKRVQAGAVTGGLTTSAITLGYSQITANAVTSTGLEGDVLSVSVVVPAGGRKIRITFNGDPYAIGTVSQLSVFIKEGATYLQTGHSNPVAINQPNHMNLQWVTLTAPSAGAHTYKVSMDSVTDNVGIEASATQPAFLLVEAI